MITNDVTIEVDLQLRVQTIEVTATNSDFQSINGDFVVVRNASTCFDVQGIINDDLVELEEMFRISLESQNLSQLQLSSPAEVTINIMDTDSESFHSYGNVYYKKSGC